MDQLKSVLDEELTPGELFYSNGPLQQEGYAPGSSSFVNFCGTMCEEIASGLAHLFLSFTV